MIEITNVHKQFNNRTVLNGINLHAETGNVVTLIGPSGTGKTTLLRCINLLEEPDQGTIEIDGVRVQIPIKNKNDILTLRRKTAMVFQQYNLFRNQTVLQNVVQPQVLVKRTNKQVAKQRAETFLQEVGMQDYQKYYPSQLSGGQQQRVSIARALALDPKVILFDEPTSALDPELSREVLNAIHKVADLGITIVLATHEMQFAEEISNQVIFMENGNVVEDGTPAEIFHHPANERTARFLENYRVRQAPIYSAQIKKFKVV
ncbi:MAG: amino acid ABC transporter ATP-binding protein [Lentilactobacillus diolivorans]|jgi:ABC-type polar amino acid transport system ATPase subunit|uniref:amino acid ABC transporter ATP-binding protein n=1 Tax=Lentilactobacillus diolivorans TaxID=179838 RepID=UPI000FED3F99|nr:amino acid ABC transporter ATP-binding protein [Lentilactobacillus diolivorans]MCH4165343.1 amino acid ABC transporter ATP-binding protein [Lentilactobacillus diolivorans]MDH5104238.1 amino acid ABC transporter ATP-binding protein [Lentilactobacillus diolivorans]RRG01422.1 MAG: amino acid ABC transporter ATP-binding protein [Lactobacillus sp.]